MGDLTMRLVLMSFVFFISVALPAVAEISWLTIATPATLEFSKEYSSFLELPAQNRKDFRFLAENEMGPYHQLIKEMEKLDHMRRSPNMYRGAGREDFSMKWVGYNSALTALDLVTSIDPSYARAWAVKGDLAFQVGALGKARESLEAALIITDNVLSAGEVIALEDRLEIYRHLAWTLRELGFNEEGLQHMERALALKPNDHELLLVKGLLLAGAGRTNEAINLAVKLPAEKYPDFSNQKSGLEMTSSGYASIWIKSQALLGAGDIQGAMHLLKDVSPYKRSLPYAAQYWNDLGLVSEMAENENAELYYSLSYATLDLKLFCPVLPLPSGTQILGYPDTNLPVLSTFGPSYYIGGSRLGFISFQMNMMGGGVFPEQQSMAAERALATLEIAERRNIRPILCKALRGRIYHVMDRFAEAEVELALARDGLAARGEVDDRTSYLLGLLALNSDRDAEAQELLEEAVQCDPEIVLYYRSLGLALAKQGKTREAEVVLEKAVVMDTYSVPALFNLGLLYCKLHRFEEAVGVLEKAYNLDSENRKVQHLLQLAASSSREQGKTLYSTNKPPAASPDQSNAYIALVMGKLDALFAAVDSTTTSQDKPHSSAIARSRYEKMPSTFNRKVLALALMDESRPAEVQELLGPFWGNDLEPDEVVILLYVDKQQGQLERAQSLAHAMLKGETGTDNPFIRLLALISLKGQDQIAGEYAVSQLAASSVTGLEALSGDDPNGYWGVYMEYGFSNYRAAVHSGYNGVDYVDHLPDPWLRSVQENEARARK